MNSDRVDEIAALRAQKKLDRQAEDEANQAKIEAEATAHEASMARIAKKMARIEAARNDEPESVVEQPAEPAAVKPKPAAKKAAAKTKSRGRLKGSKNRK
jgi:hypothetical protein